MLNCFLEKKKGNGRLSTYNRLEHKDFLEFLLGLSSGPVGTVICGKGVLAW